jgi:hypothetical protein
VNLFVGSNVEGLILVVVGVKTWLIGGQR